MYTRVEVMKIKKKAIIILFTEIFVYVVFAQYTLCVKEGKRLIDCRKKIRFGGNRACKTQLQSYIEILLARTHTHTHTLCNIMCIDSCNIR